MAKIKDLAEVHTAYIGAFYFIIFELQIAQFEQSEDPLNTAIVRADHMRRTLLDSSEKNDLVSQIVIEFFEEIVEEFKSRTAAGQG